MEQAKRAWHCADSRRISVMILLGFAGVIHVLPASGVLGEAWLQRLYDVPLRNPDLVILMRHRAVLFGLFGGFLIYGGLNPRLQSLATFAGLVSALSFIWLAWGAAPTSPALHRVWTADVAAAAALVAAGALQWSIRKREADLT